MFGCHTRGVGRRREIEEGFGKSLIKRSEDGKEKMPINRIIRGSVKRKKEEDPKEGK
jgi:hypothetical protein